MAGIIQMCITIHVQHQIKTIKTYVHTNMITAHKHHRRSTPINKSSIMQLQIQELT